MFSIGQRVRFRGTLPYSNTELIGREGVVTAITLGGKLVVGGDLRLMGCRPGNLELVKPLSALETNLAAYIAAEKKELGLA